MHLDRATYGSASVLVLQFKPLEQQSMHESVELLTFLSFLRLISFLGVLGKQGRAIEIPESLQTNQSVLSSNKLFAKQRV